MLFTLWQSLFQSPFKASDRVCSWQFIVNLPEMMTELNSPENFPLSKFGDYLHSARLRLRVQLNIVSIQALSKPVHAVPIPK